MSNTRHTEISVAYTNSRTKKTYSLDDRVEEITITDNAVGEGDTVDITVMDKDRKMVYDYYPGVDDMVKCTVSLYGMDGGKTGVVGNQTFHIDQFSYNDFPSKMTLRGIAVPKNSTFAKTPKTKTWKNTTLNNIVWFTCHDYGLPYYRESGAFNPHIEKVEQSNATDLSFLFNISQTYGNGMKIFSDRLVIFSEEEYEKKAAVRTITHSDIIDGSFSARFDLIRQYTGYEYEYDVGDVHWTRSHYFVTKPEIKISIGQCESQTDGELKGSAKVNLANRDMQMVTFEIIGDPKMISTATFNLSGYGGLDGKYYINKVTNKFTASNGFTQEIEARKIQQRL